MTKRLSLPTDSRDIVLTFAATNHGGQSETVSGSAYTEADGKMFKIQTPILNQTIEFLFQIRKCVQFQRWKAKDRKVLHNRGAQLQNR